MRRTQFMAVVFTLWAAAFLSPSLAADPSKYPQNMMTCGVCPEGYVKTGVTSDPKICKEGDPTLVECVKVGANLLAVCGSCPDGYQQIGSSSVPARCGDGEGGRMSQCQLSTMEGGVVGPGQGGVFCPPNCAGRLPTPGQGALEPPPKVRSLPEENK